MNLVRVIIGTIIHTPIFSEIEILPNRAIGILNNGSISFIEEIKNNIDDHKSKWSSDIEIIHVKEPQFIIPGLIDSHIHAPQYSFTGTGYDLPLLKWLEKYTFPAESKLSDCNLAEKVYSGIIDSTLSNGTTTAAYYATIDLKSTELLVKLLYKKGQRALVGKVNMNQNSPDNYIENTDDSINETKSFIEFVNNEYNKQVESSLFTAKILPIITPRFVPSCSSDLLQRLGNLAKEFDLHIQSHISENTDEVKWVSNLHPSIKSYAEIYNHFGLLSDKSIMGHGVYLTDKELQLFHKNNAGISHCPISNFALRSGVFNLRNALKHNVKVGLGTDVSGGYATSIIEVMRQAIIASTTIYFTDKTSLPLSYKEVFYLATQGNAKLLNFEDKIGTLEEGKFFDALIIDPACKDSPFQTYDFVANSIEDIFQKFIFLGNNINVRQVYVQGKLRHSK